MVLLNDLKRLKNERDNIIPQGWRWAALSTDIAERTGEVIAELEYLERLKKAVSEHLGEWEGRLPPRTLSDHVEDRRSFRRLREVYLTNPEDGRG